jgi:hypothetical protein
MVLDIELNPSLEDHLIDAVTMLAVGTEAGHGILSAQLIDHRVGNARRHNVNSEQLTIVEKVNSRKSSARIARKNGHSHAGFWDLRNRVNTKNIPRVGETAHPRIHELNVAKLALVDVFEAAVMLARFLIRRNAFRNSTLTLGE